MDLIFLLLNRDRFCMKLEAKALKGLANKETILNLEKFIMRSADYSIIFIYNLWAGGCLKRHAKKNCHCIVHYTFIAFAKIPLPPFLRYIVSSKK